MKASNILPLIGLYALTACSDAGGDPKSQVVPTDSDTTPTIPNVDSDTLPDTDVPVESCPIQTLTDFGIQLKEVVIPNTTPENPSNPPDGAESWWNWPTVPHQTSEGDHGVIMFGLRNDTECPGGTPIVGTDGRNIGCFPALGGYQGFFLEADGISDSGSKFVVLKGVADRTGQTITYIQNEDGTYREVSALSTEDYYGGVSFAKDLPQGYDAFVLKKDDIADPAFKLCMVNFDQTSPRNEYCDPHITIDGAEPPYLFGIFGATENLHIMVLRGQGATPASGEVINIDFPTGQGSPFTATATLDYIPEGTFFTREKQAPYGFAQVAPMGGIAWWRHNTVPFRAVFDGPNVISTLSEDEPIGLSFAVASTHLFNPTFNVDLRLDEDQGVNPLFPRDLTLYTQTSGAIMNEAYADALVGSNGQSYGRMWQPWSIPIVSNINGTWAVYTSMVIPVGDDGGTALAAMAEIDGLIPADYPPIPVEGMGLHFAYEAPITASCPNERARVTNQPEPREGQLAYDPNMVYAGTFYTERQLKGYAAANYNDIDFQMVNPREVYPLEGGEGKEGVVAVSVAVSLPNRARTGPHPERQAPPKLLKWERLSAEVEPSHKVWSISVNGPHYGWKALEITFTCASEPVSVTSVVNNSGTQTNHGTVLNDYLLHVIADYSCDLPTNGLTTGGDAYTAAQVPL